VNLLACTNCRTPLADANFFNTPDWVKCPACEKELRYQLFPAAFQKIEAGSAGERVLAEGESSCFYHPQKKAAAPCDFCGRFLCALCDVEFDGGHFCMGCLEKGREKQRFEKLENRRMLHGRIAFSLAVLPIIAWPLTLFTAPAALYVALKNWNAPSSLVRSHRSAFVGAIIIAGLQVAAWSAGLVWLASQF
jgi:hypothetical protein